MNNYITIKVSYCGLQNLLKYTNPVAYTRGVYGWNCDIYTFGRYAIATGYRPFGEVSPDYDIVKIYENKASEINDISELNKLIQEFIKVVANK